MGRGKWLDPRERLQSLTRLGRPTDVAGVQEIIELNQGAALAHIYRREGAASWQFDAIDGLDFVPIISLKSVGIEIPLSEVYEFVDLGIEDADE
jgi:hypothetical protein